MSEVGAHGVTDDSRLRGRPADAGREQVVLQAQEGAQRQPDVVALRPGAAGLAALHLGALLDAAVVGLDRPAVLRHLLPRQVTHPQVAAGPVRTVAVWGDDLEYLHQPVTRQPHLR